MERDSKTRNATIAMATLTSFSLVLFFLKYDEIEFPCLSLLALCTMSAKAAYSVLGCCYTPHSHCQSKTGAIFPRVELCTAFVSLLSPKNNCSALLGENNLHQVPESHFVWQPTAPLVFCLPVSVIGGFGCGWDVCLKIQRSCFICGLLMEMKLQVSTVLM